MLSMKIFWMHQGGLFLFFLLLGTVSGMDPSSPSTSDSQLSTLGSQLMQLQEQVEALQQDKSEDKEQIVQLMKITEELGNRVSLLESKCGSADMETDTEKSGPLMAIGGAGSNRTKLRSAEVLNTSCDFPLPEYRYGHISVTTTDGKTLVCGGYTVDDRLVSRKSWSCLQFDYESKSWKEHSTFNSTQHRYRASAVSLSKGTYVLGGGGLGSYSTEFLATGSSVWTQGPEFYGPGVFKSCVTKLSDTEFVIIGGSDDTTQVVVYNEETDEWRELPSLTINSEVFERIVGGLTVYTVGVKGHSCVALGDIILIAGGYNYPNSLTFVYDTKTGSAREVASLKYPRANGYMGLYGGKPLILGGFETYDHGKRRMRSDGEMWNMDTETWEEADINLNNARAGFTLVTMAEEIDCE